MQVLLCLFGIRQQLLPRRLFLDFPRCCRTDAAKSTAVSQNIMKQFRVGEADLITATPQLVKVCSAKFVGELVKRAIAGLTMTHLPVPPPAIPARVESQYFAISKEGPFWDHIVQTKRVGIYVPGDLPEAELEFLVLLDK